MGVWFSGLPESLTAKGRRHVRPDTSELALRTCGAWVSVPHFSQELVFVGTRSRVNGVSCT
jgi:hypothetical protein